MVSIVIPVHNHWAYTVRCLVAVLDHSRDVAHEVIVVDNGSSDETPAGLAQLGGVRVHRNPTNLGFGRACNQGAALARGEFVLFLNNDTEPRRGWLAALIAAAREDPAVTAAGSRLLFADDAIQSAGLLLAYGLPYPLSVIPRGYRKPAGEAPSSGPVRAVTGACMLVRAAAFRAAGGFDEGFENGYEDVDLCLRFGEAGGKVLFVAESVVTHHEAVSGGRFKNEAANLDRLQQRWMERLPRAWFDVVFMRKDPPFDDQFLYDTMVLELAEMKGALVVNRPQGLRDANEKHPKRWRSFRFAVFVYRATSQSIRAARF